MSDFDTTTDEKQFAVDKAKRSRAICKICRQKCLTGEIRIAKCIPEGFGSGVKKNWHHVDCIFKQFLDEKFSYIRIESSDDIDGWSSLTKTDQKLIEEKIKKSKKDIEEKYTPKNLLKIDKENAKNPVSKIQSTMDSQGSSAQSFESLAERQLFKPVCQLILNLVKVKDNFQKTCLISKMFFSDLGLIEIHFRDDLTFLCKLSVPDFDKSPPFSIELSELTTTFCKLCSTAEPEEAPTTPAGVTTIICNNFARNRKIKPAENNVLTLQEVVEFIGKIHDAAGEDERYQLFAEILPKCTVEELRMILKLLTNSIRVNISMRNILDMIHSNAFEFYEGNPNLDDVMRKYLFEPYPLKPLLPVLFSDCKSVGEAMMKCPNGVVCEINLEGERVHIHRRKEVIRYYQLYQKTRLASKFKALSELVFTAFPYPTELILDCEILTRDPSSKKPIKPGITQVVNLAILVNDCMYMDGDLTQKPITRRRKLMLQRSTEIPNLVNYSTLKEISRIEDLNEMISELVQYDFGGLLFKDSDGRYKTRQNEWFKIDRNYFDQNRVSVDLIVLGGWLEPSGDKKKPIFLMGCYDHIAKNFRTVVKVRSADVKIKLQVNAMVKIDSDRRKVPGWLVCPSDYMIPQYIAKDPKSQAVWKISGVELIYDVDHSANQISLLYPKLAKTNTDKSWGQATDLAKLEKMYKELNPHLVGVTKPELNPIFKIKPEKAAEASEEAAGASEEAAGASEEAAESSEEAAGSSEEAAGSSEKQPESEATPSTSSEPETFEELKPIPQYFKDIGIHLEHEMVGKHTRWVKYFTECGGSIVDKDKAIYLLHYRDTYPQEKMHLWSRDAIHIIVEWIKDTIKRGSLQDDRPYRVTLLPYGYVEGQESSSRFD